jgi:cold shock CspA family protein/ribosome-associated translation inhibitor RaiA
MHIPIEIDFQGMKANEPVRALVLKQVAVLEDRFGRMTTCRVAIKAPSERHHSGGTYEINIRVSLPQGREVDIGRTNGAADRHTDVTVAINDAFKRARRRLREQARRMQGEIKSHDGPPIATVRSVDDLAGFGFLQTSDGREVYFHRNSVLGNAFSQLAPGARVTFFEEMGEKGPQASTVKLLGKHGLR